MATFDMPIIGDFAPDTSGDVWPSYLDIQLAMSNAKHIPCYVMEYPTGADIGGELSFVIPQNYVGSPQIVIKGVLDGTPSSTLAFGAQQVAVGEAETTDVAYETEDLASNATWTGYADEEEYTEVITLTPASAYQVGDEVHLWLFRDDDVDGTTFDFLLTKLFFRYADA